MNYPSSVLTDSPAAYLRLGEKGGTNAADASGNGRNGTYVNSPTLGVVGMVAGDSDTCASFVSASNQHVTTSGLDTLFGGGSAITIEAIVSRTSSSVDVNIGFDGTINFRCEIIWSHLGNLYFTVDTGTGQGYGFVALSGTGRHHVVLVFDGSLVGNARIAGYIDGVQQTLSNAGSSALPATVPTSANLGPFLIANNSDGRVDEVAVYASALSSSRVSAHYVQMGDPETEALTSTATGGLRNNYGDYVGCKFTPSVDIYVKRLGRWKVAGNSQTHTIKLVNASTGVDVPGGSITLDLSAYPGGVYVYDFLASPIHLVAGTSYYLMSLENISGDQWYDAGFSAGTYTTSGSMTLNGSAYRNGSTWAEDGNPNNTYVPPNFIYSLVAPSSGVTQPTDAGFFM